MSNTLRTPRNRLRGKSLVVMVLVGVIGTVTLSAQEAVPPGGPPGSGAEAVLARRGLRRVGNLYLLDSEIAAREAIAQDRAALGRLRAEFETVLSARQQGQQQWDAITWQLQDLEYQRNNLIAFEVSLLKRTDPNAAYLIAAVRIQIHGLQDQIGRLITSQTLLESDQLRRAQRLDEIQVEITQREAEAGRRAEELRAAYRELTRDYPEVIGALKELNRTARPWVMIGPESEYNSNVVRFAQAVIAGAGMRVDPKQSQVSMAAEAEVRDLGHRAWVLQQKLKGLQGAESRREMVQVVDRLRGRIEEVQRAYETQPSDPLVVAAIEHYGRSLGKRLRVTPTADYVKEVKRLPEFEEVVTTGP